METSELKTYKKTSQNRSFTLTETESPGNHTDELHWHTSIELLYVHQGTVRLQIELETCTLHTSDIVFIDSARNHALIYTPNSQTLSLKISAVWLHYIIPDFFKEDIILCSPDIQTYEERENAEELCRTLLLLKDIFYSEGIYSDVGINGYIFILLYNLISNFRGTKTAAPLKNKYDTMLHQTIRYLHLHYMDEIHMKDIADMLGVSPQYISKLFHNYYSMTFKQYLTKIRLEHAVYDMLHTTNSLLDIALDCGFSSQHAFINTFKKKYQMLPSKYKEKVLSGKLQ